MKKLVSLIALATLACVSEAQDAAHFVLKLTATNDPQDELRSFDTLSLNGNVFTFFVAIVHPLSGAVDGAIHGPAELDVSGPVIFNLGTTDFCELPYPRDPGSSPCIYERTFTISNEQAADLLQGLWYVIVRVPGGNVYRGQILLDSDRDGVANSTDECPATPSGVLVNSSGCSIDQLCPCDGAWKNHAEYVRCIRGAATSFVQEGILNRADARTITRRAAESNCGRR